LLLPGKLAVAKSTRHVRWPASNARRPASNAGNLGRGSEKAHWLWKANLPGVFKEAFDMNPNKEGMVKGVQHLY